MFKFDDETATIAYLYLYRKLESDPMYLSAKADLNEEQKEEANRRLTSSNGKEQEKYALLRSWCDTYLSKKQFDALRATVRKKKSRKNQQYKTVDVTTDTYYNLNDLAAESGMTIKNYLDKLINEKYEVEKPPVSELKKRRKTKNV